jgi:hypothetical protein
MASKPTVTLTLAGDEKKLTEAFDRVGAASKSMADKVDDSSKTMSHAGERFETATESFDTLDTRAMGFRDTLTGLQDGFQGLTNDSDSLLDTLLLLGFGIGDLASGFVNFLLPMLKTFWTTLVESVIPAVWSFTSALLANPITWVVIGIIALIAIIVLLVKHWDWVKEAASNAAGWVRDRWNDLMGWFAGIPAWFGRIFGAVGDAIAGAFKGALNWVIDRLNWLVDRANDLIYGINLVNPFSDIPAIPHIPRMHTGGVVPGPPGSETMAILQAGEQVTSAGSASGGGAVALYVAPGGDQEVASLIDRLVQTGVITAVVAA